MSIDDDLDRLLQGAFDQARPTGHEDIRGLREGAVAKAHRIRRRRRIDRAREKLRVLLGGDRAGSTDQAIAARATTGSDGRADSLVGRPAYPIS